MRLYEHEFAKLSDTKTRVMIAKARHTFMANSKKLSQVHISPITRENHGDYAMDITHSSDRCIRLLFSQGYTARQSRKMIEEIKLLAAKRLEETIGTGTEEDNAFKSALEYLTKL